MGLTPGADWLYPLDVAVKHNYTGCTRMFTDLRHPDASETSCPIRTTGKVPSMSSTHQCGGATAPDATGAMIAMGTLPAGTSASIRLALKGIYNYGGFKDTLRDNIRILEEHGGTSGAQAHILQDAQGNI